MAVRKERYHGVQAFSRPGPDVEPEQAGSALMAPANAGAEGLPDLSEQEQRRPAGQREEVLSGAAAPAGPALARSAQLTELARYPVRSEPTEQIEWMAGLAMLS